MTGRAAGLCCNDSGVGLTVGRVGVGRGLAVRAVIGVNLGEMLVFLSWVCGAARDSGGVGSEVTKVVVVGCVGLLWGIAMGGGGAVPIRSAGAPSCI